MDRTNHYVYTLDLIDGRQYIGMHSTDLNPSTDGYLGSGNGYNRKTDVISKHILRTFNTRREAFTYETTTINNYNARKSPSFANNECGMPLGSKPTGGKKTKSLRIEEEMLAQAQERCNKLGLSNLSEYLKLLIFNDLKNE